MFALWERKCLAINKQASAERIFFGVKISGCDLFSTNSNTDVCRIKGIMTETIVILIVPFLFFVCVRARMSTLKGAFVYFVTIFILVFFFKKRYARTNNNHLYHHHHNIQQQHHRNKCKADNLIHSERTYQDTAMNDSINHSRSKAWWKSGSRPV